MMAHPYRRPNPPVAPREIYEKKQNIACHFCEHAAKRRGRRKVALLVACSIPGCRKVFCSRPGCCKKLAESIPSLPNIENNQDFGTWKVEVDAGRTYFVCPHCLNDQQCAAPQCRKKRMRLSLGKGGAADGADSVEVSAKRASSKAKPSAASVLMSMQDPMQARVLDSMSAPIDTPRAQPKSQGNNYGPVLVATELRTRPGGVATNPGNGPNSGAPVLASYGTNSDRNANNMDMQNLMQLHLMQNQQMQEMLNPNSFAAMLAMNARNINNPNHSGNPNLSADGRMVPASMIPTVPASMPLVAYPYPTVPMSGPPPNNGNSSASAASQSYQGHQGMPRNRMMLDSMEGSQGNGSPTTTNEKPNNAHYLYNNQVNPYSMQYASIATSAAISYPPYPGTAFSKQANNSASAPQVLLASS